MFNFDGLFKREPKFNPERDSETGKPVPKELPKVTEEEIVFQPVSKLKSILEDIAYELGPADPTSEYDVPPVKEYKLRNKKVYFTHFKSSRDEYVLMTCLIKETKQMGTVVLNQPEVDAFFAEHYAKGLKQGTMTIQEFNRHYLSDCYEVDLDCGPGSEDFSTQHMPIIKEL